jgi:four helix bundle protein
MSDQKIKSYRELLIWQKGIELVKEIYILTRKLPKMEKFTLVDQMHRSAISIPSNIAEGQARQHPKEFRQFLFMALGSLAELDTHLVVAKELEYLTENDLKNINEKITEIRRMTRGLLSKLITGNL